MCLCVGCSADRGNGDEVHVKRRKSIVRDLVCVAAMAWVTAMPVEAADGPILRTGAGMLQGLQHEGADAYLGIPYAQPPVGERRWRAPRAIGRWQGVRDATKFAASCYQAAPRTWGPFTDEFVQVGTVSEDCLYLNIWTSSHRSARLPTMPEPL